MNIFDVQCMKFLYKFVNKLCPEYFCMMFKFNDELYKIETCDQNQLHLFPARAISASNVLKHHIPDMCIQRANTHSIE